MGVDCSLNAGISLVQMMEQRSKTEIGDYQDLHLLQNFSSWCYYAAQGRDVVGGTYGFSSLIGFKAYLYQSCVIWKFLWKYGPASSGVYTSFKQVHTKVRDSVPSQCLSAARFCTQTEKCLKTCISVTICFCPLNHLKSW